MLLVTTHECSVVMRLVAPVCVRFIYQSHQLKVKVTGAKVTVCPVRTLTFESLELKTSVFGIQVHLQNIQVTGQSHMSTATDIHGWSDPTVRQFRSN